MGRHRQGQEVQEFRFVTERITGRRVRFKVQAIPEIVAWLVMMAERYTRTRLAAAAAMPGTSDELLGKVREECKAREEVIQQLLNCLPDPWGVGRWEEVTTQIARDMGITIGEPIPPTVRDDAKETVLTEGE